MGLLVNIDNGGTFTDVCVSDGDRVVHTKTPTTPHDLTRCFVDVLRLVSESWYGEEDLEALLRATECLRYSTTSGTNAVVERTVAPVGLLVSSTAGGEAYGAAALMDTELWGAMVPGKPAGLELAEDGSFDELALLASVNDLIAAGVSRIVVALASASAERRVKATLLQRYPRHMLGAVPFLLSHELSPDDHDDARRTTTAVVNASLHPGMEHFLYGAESAVSEKGLAPPLLIFRNDGGSARIAKTAAITTWGSGPRGGIEGARAYARLYGTSHLVTMDIGGTTTDVSVLTGDTLQQDTYGHVDTAQVSFPLPRLHSFGLGGSSVVAVSDGRITVGPHSVGASPGPACFGRGGTSVTLTDALLVLGVLDAQRYLGGTLSLDVDRALNVLEEQIARPLGIDALEAARAVLDSFADLVGAHLRELMGGAAVEPTDVTLLAYGGGGPVVATSIARAAGLGTVIIPELASVFSAFGIGFSGIAHDYVRTPLDTPAENEQLLDELLLRARRHMYGEGVDPDAVTYDLALRSDEGGLLVETPVDRAGAIAAAGGKVRLRAVSPLRSFELKPDDLTVNRTATSSGEQHIGPDVVPVHDASSLVPGEGFAGPCLVRGDYLTANIAAGWNARVSSNNDLILEAQA